MGNNENKDKDNSKLKWLYEHLVKSIVSWMAIAALIGVGYSIIIINKMPGIEAKVKKHDIYISSIPSINAKLKEFDDEFKIIKVCLYKIMKETGTELSDEQLKDFLSLLQIPESIHEELNNASVADKEKVTVSFGARLRAFRKDDSVKVIHNEGLHEEYFTVAKRVADTQTPKTLPEGKYVVESGFTLENVVRQYFGDFSMWRKIYDVDGNEIMWRKIYDVDGNEIEHKILFRGVQLIHLPKKEFSILEGVIIVQEKDSEDSSN